MKRSDPSLLYCFRLNKLPKPAAYYRRQAQAFKKILLDTCPSPNPRSYWYHWLFTVLLQKIFWPHSTVVMNRSLPQHLVWSMNFCNRADRTDPKQYDSEVVDVWFRRFGHALILLNFTW